MLAELEKAVAEYNAMEAGLTWLLQHPSEYEEAGIQVVELGKLLQKNMDNTDAMSGIVAEEEKAVRQARKE